MCEFKFLFFFLFLTPISLLPPKTKLWLKILKYLLKKKKIVKLFSIHIVCQTNLSTVGIQQGIIYKKLYKYKIFIPISVILLGSFIKFNLWLRLTCFIFRKHQKASKNIKILKVQPFFFLIYFYGFKNWYVKSTYSQIK